MSQTSIAPEGPKLETIAVPLRTEKGAEVRRVKEALKPKHLEELWKHVLKNRTKIMTEESERVKSKMGTADPSIKIIEPMGFRFQAEPGPTLRIGEAVNTYVIVTEGPKALTVRKYAHIPAPFLVAVKRLIEGFEFPVIFSDSDFIRPGGI